MRLPLIPVESAIAAEMGYMRAAAALLEITCATGDPHCKQRCLTVWVLGKR
jgi:hypothetical protein